MRLQSHYLHIFLVTVCCTCISSVECSDTRVKFFQVKTSKNESNEFNHLAVDPVSGTVYVAGINHIFQLTPDLELQAHIKTGPIFDSSKCHATGCNALDIEAMKVPLDNINKVLIVDSEHRNLIACGSVLQGACTKYNLSNITVSPEFIGKSIAANDANSSTFAFIGPERYNKWSGSNVLYVGTTFTNNGEYRHDVPAISSRNLITLDYSEYSFSKQSLLNIDVKYRDNFLVKYVYGFSATAYTYFVIMQRRSHLPGQEEAGYITRLARTCITDANYDTYTELTLQCIGDDGTDYNLVQTAQVMTAGNNLALLLDIDPSETILVTAFAPSVDHTTNPENHSAICIYTLQNIDTKFNENIHMCFNGTMQYRNLGYISGSVLDGKCPKVGATGNIFNFCEIGLKLSGKSPIVSRPTVIFRKQLITSLALLSVQQKTVAFMGTNNGHLKKVILDDTYGGYQYGEIVIDPQSPILFDLLFDLSYNHLYVLSKTKVTKVKIDTCNTITDCAKCLESSDPFCGWCSLERKCTTKSDCLNATLDSFRWLNRKQQCVDFEYVIPYKMPITHMTLINLTIQTTPILPPAAKYRCVFGNFSSEAIITSNGLICSSPPLHLRPSIPAGRDYISIPLSVWSSQAQKIVVNKDFIFYDCLHHQTCLSCINSKWDCSWCIYENKCTHNSSSCHRTAILGINHRTSHRTSRSDLCPHIRSISEELVIPNGVKSEIILEIDNLPRPQIDHMGFQCLITIEGAKMIVSAKVEMEYQIVCEETMFSYESIEPEYIAEITVVWNRNYYLVSRNFTIFKCELLGSHKRHPDCSLCLTRPQKYDCIWCNNMCVHKKSCKQFSYQPCPRPRIDVIRPLQGPIEGGTLITIEGSNLGLSREEVQENIRIGNSPCELIDYEVSIRLVCKTGAFLNAGEAPVIVGNNAGFTQAVVKFWYQEVSITEIFPNVGPCSGGTLLTITGSYLNIGTHQSVFLDDIPCVINSMQSTQSRLICRTSKSSTPRVIHTLIVAIDNARRSISQNPFTYIADPVITEIKPIKTFDSGGRVLNIYGTNFEAIQKIELVVFFDNVDYIMNKTVCYVRNSSHLICPSPAVDRHNLPFQITSKYPITRYASLFSVQNSVETYMLPMKIGFIMDDVNTVKDLLKYFQSRQYELLYVQDPVIKLFENDLKVYKGDMLVIEGENLNGASDESDIVVTIGTQICNLTSLTATQLICLPPIYEPLPTDENGNPTEIGLPSVVVKIGLKLRYSIGYLQYEVNKSDFFPAEAIAGISAGTLFLVIIFLIILSIYRRKSNQAEKEYKRIQIQMDTLESNVRQECKQAFAELQTDISDLITDLDKTGIPIVSQRVYIMKVFFPGIYEHPILNQPMAPVNDWNYIYDNLMLEFDKLISIKNFLLNFICTLENQMTFTIKDKVNVASLLMIILLNRMEYATLILKSLLKKLLAKTINLKHPQVFLRRTESVVEKMLTNWIAVCMYDYVKNRAGTMLFLLFKAIKVQVEKGPVDFLTHDSRYSLSEDKLLKEQIHYNYVTIHVIADEPCYEKIPYNIYHAPNISSEEKIQIKVLDCDAISQVKLKILDALYKNTPISLRPTVHEVDLEWRSAKGMHLILADEDVTSKCIDKWKKINTLSHYGIRDSALIALVQRQLHVDSDSSNYAYPYSCKNIPNGDIGNGNVYKTYHLTRCGNLSLPSNDNSPKAIPEMFLTRLLSTKGTIQKFVDDFMSTVLTVDENFPLAIKWLFDLLDKSAVENGISDWEVIHAWKSNSLPLRFWINLIKNPEFILDVMKTITLDSCLSVISQTFIDSCSTNDLRLGKDSPSNKLLFAKDIPHYRDMVSRFYNDIRELPQITDQELSVYMQRLSADFCGQFDILSALKELFIYVLKYQDEVLIGLSTDVNCNGMRFSEKLRDIIQSVNLLANKFSHPR